MKKVVALPTANATSERDWSQLLRQMAVTGDRSLFVALFQHYAPRLKGYMLRLGVLDSVVEELVQESMLTVWHKADSFNPERAEAGAWIFTLARNKAIDWMRKQKYPTVELDSLREDAPSSDNEQGEQQLFRQQVSAAVASLPEEQAQVIYMSFYEGRSHAEIAAKLAIPLGSVKSRIRLAANKLRNQWEETQ